MSDGMSDGMSELDSLEPNDSLILPVNIGQCDRKNIEGCCQNCHSLSSLLASLSKLSEAVLKG